MRSEEQEFVSVPVKPTEGMLRPFYDCPPDELELAWNAMLAVAKNQQCQVWTPAQIESAKERGDELAAWLRGEDSASLSTPPDIPKGAVGVTEYLESQVFHELCMDYRASSVQFVQYRFQALQESIERAFRSATPVSPEPAAHDHEWRAHPVTKAMICRYCGIDRPASQPAEAVSDEAILHRWDTHVGEPNERMPLTDGDKISFARAILALAATPVAAQPAGLDADCIAGIVSQRGYKAPAAAVEPAKVEAIFRANCVHYAGNYEVTPGQARQIAKALATMAAEPVAPAKGAFACRLCGQATPHHHSEFEQLMAMSEAEIDAELRANGIEPNDAARRAKGAIEAALSSVAEPVEGAEPASKIERDEAMDRTYIPMPGGWEVQTQGKGSSFRICDTKTGTRWIITDKMAHKALEQMARDANAAAHHAPASAQAGAVPELRQAIKDAARYRWLRATTNTFTNDAGERISVKLQPEEFDAAIDAALYAAPKGESK